MAVIGYTLAALLFSVIFAALNVVAGLELLSLKPPKRNKDYDDLEWGVDLCSVCCNATSIIISFTCIGVAISTGESALDAANYTPGNAVSETNLALTVHRGLSRPCSSPSSTLYLC
jgi:hypothetical protein